jgi:hypothetical protein
MSDAPLRHLVDRAWAVHGPRFEDWFPRSFDWKQFVADIPRLAREVGGPPIPRVDEAEFEDRVDRTFRAAFLAGLAVLAASHEGEEDPDLVLETLASPPDEEVDDDFGAFLEEHMGSVEKAVAAETFDDLPEEAAAVGRLAEAIWPVVFALLDEDPLADFDAPEGRGSVLVGVARVATILACVRWWSGTLYESSDSDAPGDDGP